ncbi:MAG TPA: PqqD family protein [Acidobacteria bacterium]|nr:PqqD family protein [Acidobacteriota bacterium]
MGISLDSSIRVNDDVLFEDLHGEGVLLNLKTGVYLGLDPVGTRVWQVLENHHVLSDIVNTMVDVDRQRCADDLLALMSDLEQHGLVTLTDPAE